jgi:centrosomal protein CEP104
LGQISFDNNEKSEYQARELKSVYIEQSCLLVKLVVRGCHGNPSNDFNQSGIVAINILGEVFALPNLISKQQKDGG